MTSRASARVREEPEDVDEYEAKRDAIEEVVDWIDDKLESGRIRDPERARARQGYLRLKIQAIAEWRKLKETSDLRELREEVDALKAERESRP